MRETDLVIIGAGAAGLSAAVYALRSGVKVTVIDEAGGGGQISQIETLENYPGLFPAVNGSDFIESLKNQAEHFGAQLIFAQVSSIDKTQDLFSVKTAKETYVSKALIIATGAVHSKLEVPGEAQFTGKGVSYCAVCDGPFFRNRIVSVAGGGESALNEALFLTNFASEVHLIHRREQFRASEFTQEKVRSNPKIKIHLNQKVKSINGNNFVESLTLENSVDGTLSKLETDGLFIFTGMIPRTNLLENLPKDEKGYIKTNEQMQTIIPGLFAAGDVRSKPLRQIVTAASDGAIAGFFAGEFAKLKN